MISFVVIASRSVWDSKGQEPMFEKEEVKNYVRLLLAMGGVGEMRRE